MRNYTESVSSFESRVASKSLLLATCNSQLPRTAMTLIELMVVVVILVTLVAGVLPLVSPNNDARKIREASRGLKTFLMAAQAEAARTGESRGIGFVAASPGSGVAIETFPVMAPPDYPGPSPNSRVAVEQLTGTSSYYGPTSQVSDGNGRTKLEKYYGAQLYRVSTLLAGSNAQDQLPPQMFRVGDIIEVEKKRFQVVDDNRNKEVQAVFGDSGLMYLDPANSSTPNTLICVWLDQMNQGGAVPAINSNALNRYKIERQLSGPTSFSIDARPPYQFPAGIAIDMQASGYERNGELVTFDSCEQLKITFSPNGGIDKIDCDGNLEAGVDRLFFLVGRGENGSVINKGDRYGSSAIYIDTNATDEQFKDLQSKVNWLNLDSRWLMIDVTSGKFKIVENALVDPRNLATPPNKTALFAKAEQIEAAHELAHNHGSQGGQ